MYLIIQAWQKYDIFIQWNTQLIKKTELLKHATWMNFKNIIWVKEALFKRVNMIPLK